jgi:pimeloyl-ACP methyl ester carboxylesterase
VLVQGMGFDRIGWQPVLAKLGRHFRLVLIDNRGSGRSDLGGPEQNMRSLKHPRRYEGPPPTGPWALLTLGALGHGRGVFHPVPPAGAMQSTPETLLPRRWAKSHGRIRYVDAACALARPAG